MPHVSEIGARWVTLRRGVVMRRRDDGKRDRVRSDHDVLATPTVTPSGGDGWAFRRGRGGRYAARTEEWYVAREDVSPESDFPGGDGGSAVRPSGKAGG